MPPAGLRQYGDELRPCKLTTHVKGYALAKNNFLFERRLNDHVYSLVKEYSRGRPALVFCRCADSSSSSSQPMWCMHALATALTARPA